MAEKVLVVDDEQHIRDIVSNYLSREGYEVAVASNGEEAIELAAIENPELILLDIKMPGLDGLETCHRIKRQKETSHIPVIMVTALGDRDVDAYLEGADDFVTKPFDAAELSIRVKSMLRIRHLKNELDRAMAYIEELRDNLSHL
ncbi:MAG: response regulator [Deltaproteobacteria bacterium]|nr:MAG: response regulator [Deltaproteobacteria bacterium]